LHDNRTATMMPVPRRQIPILIVARFLSRLPRYNWAYREVAEKVPVDADVSNDWKISEALGLYRE
jgi:hypothetical protein